MQRRTPFTLLPLVVLVRPVTGRRHQFVIAVAQHRVQFGAGLVAQLLHSQHADGGVGIAEPTQCHPGRQHNDQHQHGEDAAPVAVMAWWDVPGRRA